MLRYYNYKDKDLLIGSIPASEIVKKYGTPLYAYDQNILQKKAELLKCNIPQEVDIFYSIKANPNVWLINILKEYGFGCEIASGGELQIALQAGIKPENIIFAGPGKSKQELEAAIYSGIYALNVESAGELKFIHHIAERTGTTANIAVRVNPFYHFKGPGITMTGKARQFGIDEDQLDYFFRCLKTMKRVHFLGIHVYIGTQNLNSKSFIGSIRQIFLLAFEIARKYKVEIEMINFGGGIGVPYYHGEVEFDIESLGRKFAELIREFFGNLPEKMRLIIEPGRYISAECGIYLTKILYKKKSRNKTFLVVDGGINQFQQIGQVIKKNFPVDIVHQVGKPKNSTASIAGRLCTSIDIMAENTALQEASPGDIIGIYKTGAYGYSAAPQFFLSHKLPVEVLVKDNLDMLIRNSDGKVLPL